MLPGLIGIVKWISIRSEAKADGRGEDAGVGKGRRSLAPPSTVVTGGNSY